MTDQPTPRTEAGRRLTDELHDEATAYFAMTSRRFSIAPMVERIHAAVLAIETEAEAQARTEALDVEAWMEIVSASLAATTEGTDWAEAPEPSDEPGSPYVRRLTNEILSRLAAKETP